MMAHKNTEDGEQEEETRALVANHFSVKRQICRRFQTLLRR